MRRTLLLYLQGHYFEGVISTDAFPVDSLPARGLLLQERAKEKQREHKETAPNIKEITTLLSSEDKSDTHKTREEKLIHTIFILYMQRYYLVFFSWRFFLRIKIKI